MEAALCILGVVDVRTLPLTGLCTMVSKSLTHLCDNVCSGNVATFKSLVGWPPTLPWETSGNEFRWSNAASYAMKNVGFAQAILNVTRRSISAIATLKVQAVIGMPYRISTYAEFADMVSKGFIVPV